MSDRAATTRRTPGPWALALLVFGGTLAWVVRFAVGYAVVPEACARGDVLLHVVTLVTALAAAGALAWSWRVLGHTEDAARRFVLMAGMALDVFFLGAILLEGSAVLFVDACTKGAV